MSDVDFLKEIENCSIPKSEWTHRAHIKMAFIYLNEFTLDESIKKIRHGLKKLNKAHGTDDYQFHETLTLKLERSQNLVFRARSDCSSMIETNIS